MKALILATILLVSVFAAQDEATATLSKLESHKFGKRLLDTIQLQLEAGDPADDLIHMLQDEEDRLQAEQDIDDEYILALENQCVEDLAKLVDEIASTRKRIQELNDLLDSLRPIKAAKEHERENLINFKNLIIEKLAEMEEAKALKDAEWEEEKEQHDSQSAIIQKVKDIIVSGLQASFLQTKAESVKTVLVQVSQHLNNAKKQHFKKKGITSIFRILAHVASSQEIQAQQSGVDRIIDLCDQLLDKIAESRAIEKADYDHWVAEYTSTKDKLTAKKEETEAKIQQLTVEIEVLGKRIAAAELELGEQEERLELKITQHDERELFCDEAGKKYAADREARSDQLEIISDAIGLLTAKIRLLKKYVSDRVVNLEKPVF